MSRLGIVLSLAFFGAACGPGRVEVGELYGIWAHESGGQITAWEMANSLPMSELSLVAPDFILYQYGAGSEPVAVMAGGFGVGERAPDDARVALIQTVAWAVEPQLVGQSFANAILAFDDEVLVLESANSASGERAYARVEGLP